MKVFFSIILLSLLISCNNKENEDKEKAKEDLISMYKNDIDKLKYELKQIGVDKETWGGCIDDKNNSDETILACGEKWKEACALYDEKKKEINELEKELLKIKGQ